MIRSELHSRAHELVPKGYNPMDGQQQMQEFGRPVSRGGISSATLNFLKLCSIMEPMQELFSFHKVPRLPSLFANYGLRRFEWSHESAWKTASFKSGLESCNQQKEDLEKEQDQGERNDQGNQEQIVAANRELQPGDWQRREFRNRCF